jgi:hypothetical protein
MDKLHLKGLFLLRVVYFLLFSLSLSNFISASFSQDINYPDEISLYYIPQPFDSSWKYNINFNGQQTINPSFTGDCCAVGCWIK